MSSSAEILPAEPFFYSMGGIPGQRLLTVINYRFPSCCGQTERWEVALVRRLHILIVQVYHIVLSDIVAIQREKKIHYKIYRVTITPSTKRPEGTDCCRRCHGNDFFFRVCDLCVTKAFFA